MKKISLSLFILLFLCTCDETKKTTNKRILPPSSGNINELVVVVNNSLWNSQIKKIVNTIFEQEVKGLPQKEPLYRIIYTTKKKINQILKTHRNILVLEIGKKNTYISKPDKYAKPQQFQNIISTSEKGLIKILKSQQQKIIDQYRRSDLKILKKKLKKTAWEKLPFLEKYKIKMNIPKAYTISKEEDDFLWLTKETRKSSLGIILYTIPIKDSSALINPNIIKIRNQMGKHIQSYVKTSFMKVEKDYLPYTKNITIDNLPCIETKGVWTMENDFMGGPFINYLIIDDRNNRLICIDGFTYSPSTEKRNIIFQLEAILQTFKNLK